MSVSSLTTALLLAGAPANPGGMPPAMPGLLSISAVQDAFVAPPETAQIPAPVEPPLSAQPPSTTDSADPASTTDPEQSEIVVQAQRRATPGDPLEAINEQSYAITQAVDKAFVAPVALAYKNALPEPVRSGIRNFFNNLGEPVVFLNYLLQLKPGKAFETAGRFAINSTIGGAGLFDIAKRRPFKLPRRSNGFANTLGYYGVKPGAFLFVPLIGPTTIRDLFGLTLDRLVLPVTVGKPFDQPAYTIPASIIGSLDYRVEFDAQLRKIRDESEDPYAASRANYLQSRQAEIDGLHRKGKAAASPAADPVTPPVPAISPQ